MPPSEPLWQFDWTKLAHCTSRPCILQNKIIIRPLRHILRFFLTKSPCGPQWVWTGPKLHVQNKTIGPCHKQHETISMSLQYLVKEEITKQDIVYGQTAGRPYRISSTSLWPVELKMTKHMSFLQLAKVLSVLFNLISVYTKYYKMCKVVCNFIVQCIVSHKSNMAGRHLF